MKKFHCKKGVSLDKAPIILRLERRHTMDSNTHGMEEDSCLMSVRAASVDSIDQLPEAPNIPRIKTRDVTKSLSEDVLSKSQLKAPKMITETDLSSSWLYKTMQASINSRFKSPRKSQSMQQTDDLAATSQDSNLQPVPVKSRAEKTSSYICHFATLIAISLCTVGFLASIAAIIYMEVFADRNLTSLKTTEAQVDISDVTFDSRDVYNLTTHTFDTHEQNVMEQFSNDIGINGANSLNENEESRNFADYVSGTKEPHLAKLNDYMNTSKTKIKFQDGETVIYEIKPAKPIEDENASSMVPKGRSNEDILSETEHSSKETTLDDTREEKQDEKPEIILSSWFEKVNDIIFTESNSKLLDYTPNGDLTKNDFKQFSPDTELKSEDVYEKATELYDSEKNKINIEQIFEKVSNFPEKLNGPEIVDLGSTKSEIIPDFEANDAFLNDNKVLDMEDNNNRVIGNVNDTVSIDDSHEFRIKHQNEISESDPSLEDYPGKDEYVSTMVVVVDDTEDDLTNSFISNRNGDLDSQFSSSKPNIQPTFMKVGGERHNSQKNPIDLKVSLAEAMKHLQILDVNNKLLSSRIKPKRKVENIKKQKTVSQKDEERKRYLQKVRLLLLKQLQ